MNVLLKYVGARFGVIVLAGVLLLTTTNPKNLPSAALILPFVFLFLTVYFGANMVFKHIAATGGSLLRPRLVAGLIAGFPTLLLVLQSIGQLTTKDIVTSAVLCLIAYFYVTKFSTSPSNPMRR